MAIKNFESNSDGTQFSWTYYQDSDPDKAEKHPSAVCLFCGVNCSTREIRARLNAEGKPISKGSLRVSLNATTGTRGDNLINAAKEGNAGSNFACGVLPQIIRSREKRHRH